jgi:hypothetical protein
MDREKYVLFTIARMNGVETFADRNSPNIV